MDTATKTSSDIFDQQRPQKLPGMLNTLTILTFIGCALSYFSLIYTYFTSTEENLATERNKIEQTLDQAGDGIAGKMLENSLQILEKSYEHRYLLLAGGLLFTTLCLIGAMQMRKLKKSGFNLYLVGELAPVIMTVAIFGTGFMSNITIAVSAFFALLFVILYATQRKYLVY